jgi:hypothetical protein
MKNNFCLHMKFVISVTYYLLFVVMVILIVYPFLLGLSNQDNHHEFCRLLARLKGNYQLSQIVEVDGYAEWITLVAEFTCSTFSAWQWAANSTYYLLSMWSRLISSMHYLKSDRDVAGLLNNVIPRVIETYVTARLESVQILHGKPEEDGTHFYKSNKNTLPETDILF